MLLQKFTRVKNQNNKAFIPAEHAVSQPITHTGFTLAEVLITLGIIGVVAALTLPTLIKSTQDKQFRARYKQSISIISQAMKQIYAETDETYSAYSSADSWIQMPVYFCKLQRQLKVAKSGIDCSKVADDTVYSSSSDWARAFDEDETKKLWHENNKWYDKKGNPAFLNAGYMPLTMDLMNGIRINFNCYNSVFVDVNGDKGPNTIGRDIYAMRFLDEQTSPMTGFKGAETIIMNGCSRNGSNPTPALNKDNFVKDCISGTGWGCKFACP